MGRFVQTKQFAHYLFIPTLEVWILHTPGHHNGGHGIAGRQLCEQKRDNRDTKQNRHG